MILPEMKQLPILENLDEAESSKLENPYPGFLPNVYKNLEDRNFDPGLLWIISFLKIYCFR